MIFVKPAAPRPISAGIQPEVDWISCTASTLKLLNVAPPHLRVARVGAIHGEDCLDATLSVDGKLLGEVCLSIGVGHRSSREQQQLAEVAFVQWNCANGLTGEPSLHPSLQHPLHEI